MASRGSPQTASPKMPSPKPGTGAAGLGITGSKPPSRTGTALRTASTAGMTPMDALRHTLIKKMREKFGEAAKDIKAQETIAAEVVSFMAGGGSMKPDDLEHLEMRIRSRLAGDTPVKNTRTMQKKQEMEKDEWAKLYKFQHEIGSLQDQRKAQMKFNTQVNLKGTLNDQMTMRHGIEADEKEEEYKYHLEQMEALKIWEQEEEMKMEKKRELIEKLKRDRQEQIVERDRRRELAKQQQQQDDDMMLRHLADLTRKDMAAEEEYKEKCRQATEQFKADNELNKKLKAEMKEKLHKEDLEYQRLYKQQLDQQEKDRQMLVQKVTEIQNKQAKRADALPPYKQFVPEEKIEAEFQAHEKYLDERERVAREAIKKKNWQTKVELDRQVHEKLVRREEDKRRELSYGHTYAKESQTAKLEDTERKMAILNKNKAYKEQLQQQMKLDAVRKKEALMSDTEKQINKQLLAKVEEYKATNHIA